MDPSITTGTRKLFTDLDMQGLSAVGWQVQAVPEPSAFLFAGLAVGASWMMRRAR